MPNEARPADRGACPHCGKPPGLRFWYLLPSSNRRRVLKCVQCGGQYDLSDASRTASIMGALLGMGPGVYVLGKIVHYGHGKPVWTVVGTAAAASLFAAGSILLGWLTRRLVKKS